jgi:hypothetical protein
MQGTEALLYLLYYGATINNFNSLGEVLHGAIFSPQYNFKDSSITNERKYLNLKLKKKGHERVYCYTSQQRHGYRCR